ncbi:MAG: fibrobacter succinogenes major paralogous domain-containing protein, partial [Culturomica sp.]|nr:fibrobacter succinogenes major paralogous domain-containing protein [Culturomica sp.]
VWYVSEAGAAEWTLIPNEVGAELSSYQQSATVSGASIAVRFKRKAVCSLGEAETTASVTVPNLKISFSPVSTTLNHCGGTAVTASVPYTATTPTFKWTTDMGTKTGAMYTPVYSDFTDGTEGTIVVKCEVKVAGCVSTADLSVNVTKFESFACGDCFTDTRDGQSYPTVQIGAQCWMTKNMNIGTLVASSDYTTYQRAGIQKICYDNDESNCTTYGGLYSWAEAVNGENVASGAINTATDFNKKYAVDGSGHTQGICPDGWHIPSDAEFQALEVHLGMSPSTANSTGWRGTDEGRELKSIDLWTAYSSSTSGTNTSGWDGRPGGHRLNSGGTFYYVGARGNWWSSSEYSSSGAWNRYLYYGGARVYRNTDTKSYGFSVRCLLN